MQTDRERLERFEKMLAFAEEQYAAAAQRMEELKTQGKTKSATFRQYMGQKLQYQSVLKLYGLFGLR